MNRRESQQNERRTPLIYRVLSAVALVVAATCSDPAAPSASVLQTDSSAYTATGIGNGQVAVRVVLTYRNPADTTVALDRCLSSESYPIYSVDLVSPANAEGAAYNPGWACVGGVSPILIGPKATRVDTITLRGPTVYDNTMQRFVGVLSGVFRVRYGGEVSNGFAITLPPTGVPLLLHAYQRQ